MLRPAVSPVVVVWMEKGVHVLARVMIRAEAVLEMKVAEAVLGMMVVGDAWVEEMGVATVVVDVALGVTVVEVGAEVDVAEVVEINWVICFLFFSDFRGWR